MEPVEKFLCDAKIDEGKIHLSPCFDFLFCRSATDDSSPVSNSHLVPTSLLVIRVDSGVIDYDHPHYPSHPEPSANDVEVLNSEYSSYSIPSLATNHFYPGSASGGALYGSKTSLGTDLAAVDMAEVLSLNTDLAMVGSRSRNLNTDLSMAVSRKLNLSTDLALAVSRNLNQLWWEKQG
ncbi:hypothetical protein LINPERHAP1_LOCUS221 [Linum perenne]